MTRAADLYPPMAGVQLEVCKVYLIQCRHAAACSRNLVVKQCLQLPVPLWREIMELLGGEYAKAAEQGNSAS